LSESKTEVKIKVIELILPKDSNIIIGQTHFLKSASDLYETLAESSPSLKFGVAFNESSGKRLVRFEGNDEELTKAAIENAKALGCGHAFVVLLRNGFPVSVLNRIKAVSEVCTVYCATANPVQVVVAETPQGRGVLGVIDGETPLGVEGAEDKAWRKDFLKKIGYKL
jgi:adenosine/AMP kinase